MKYILNCSLWFILLSCNKLVEVKDNSTIITSNNIKSNPKLLEGYVNNLYNEYFYLFGYVSGSNFIENINYLGAALADEIKPAIDLSTNLKAHSAFINDYYSGTPNSYNIPDLFVKYYKLIINCNNVISIVSNNEENVEIFAEMRAMRSILYYYLASLYGPIPLLTSPNIDENFEIGLSPQQTIYEFCISELEDVRNSIKTNKSKLDYSNTNYSFSERINKDIVTYFLSVLYLEIQNYELSADYSLELINNYTLESNIDNKFKKNSSDNIWIIEPSYPDFFMTNVHVFFNYKFVPYSAPNYFRVNNIFALSDFLIEKFDYNDKRRIFWIDSVEWQSEIVFLPNKYKAVGSFLPDMDERLILIRLPTVYFNLIEAYLMDENYDLAYYYMNELNAVNYFSYDDSYILNMDFYLDERSKEMFLELGDRWLTLKRTHKLTEVMSYVLPIKSHYSNTWDQTSMENLPIPKFQELLNPNLK